MNFSVNQLEIQCNILILIKNIIIANFAIGWWSRQGYIIMFHISQETGKQTKSYTGQCKIFLNNTFIS